jgi:hypothetical protein
MACVCSIALASATLVPFWGTAKAFLPSPEQAAVEIPLPFHEGKLAYGDAVALLSIPPVASSIGEHLGGKWSVYSWNRQARSPHYILGTGADVAPALQSRSDAEAAARNVLTQNADALGLDPDEMRVEVVAEGIGKVAVHYQQTYRGLDVLGGRAHATFLKTGRVFAMGADFYRVEGLNVVPSISRAEAERIAIEDLPHRDRALSSKPDETAGLYVLPYPTSVESVEPRLVWRVHVETDGRTGLWVTHVDGVTGEILWRRNDVHYIDYLGSLEGDVQHSTWCNGAANQRMKYMEVSVTGGGTTTSDGNGDWTISNDDETDRLVSARFFGPFAGVNRAEGGVAVSSAVALPGVPVTLRWDDGNSRRDERDVFDAVSDMHDFFESIDPGYEFVNERITANVGVSGTCNAFWDGSINFYNAGAGGCGTAGCANTGEIQGIVHHEYGHGVQDHLIGGQGDEGCGEGNGDILANFMTDESIIAHGFCVSGCSRGIRDSDNDHQYPESMTGEVHDDGRIIAGVMWDVRENLQNSLGFNAGKEQAAILWHFGRKVERPENQPDQCLSMFIVDDDNGNVFDGTPHFVDICQAVMAHDEDGDAFDCPEAGSIWVDFAHTGSEDGSQARPYNSLFQAHGAAPIGYIMKVRSGASAETGTLTKPGVVRAMGGVVRVGP